MWYVAFVQVMIDLSKEILNCRKSSRDEVIGGDGVTARTGARAGDTSKPSAFTRRSSYRIRRKGSTPRPQLGRLNLLITSSARSLILKVFPLGQVHSSGRALPEHGLLRYSMENGML